MLHTRIAFLSVPVLLWAIAGTAVAADPPKPKPVNLTRDELRTCMTLKDEIDTRRATYERERKAHDDAWQLIVKETSDINAAKDLVDTKDPKSVSAFNDRISARNKSAEAHNAHAQVVNTSGSELQGVQQRYIDACNERPFLVGDRDALLKERAAAAAASAPAKP